MDPTPMIAFVRREECEPTNSVRRAAPINGNAGINHKKLYMKTSLDVVYIGIHRLEVAVTSANF